MKAFCDGWLVGKRTSKVTSKSSNRAAGQQKQQGKSSTPQSRGSTGKERGLTRTPADWTVRGKRSGQASPLCFSNSARTGEDLPIAFLRPSNLPIPPQRRLGRFKVEIAARVY